MEAVTAFLQTLVTQCIYSSMLIWCSFCYAFVFVWVGGFLNTAFLLVFCPMLASEVMDQYRHLTVCAIALLWKKGCFSVFVCFWVRISLLRCRRSPHAVLPASCMLRFAARCARCVYVWRVMWWVVHTHEYGGLSFVLFVLSPSPVFLFLSFSLSLALSLVLPQPIRANLMNQ